MVLCTIPMIFLKASRLLITLSGARDIPGKKRPTASPGTAPGCNGALRGGLLGKRIEPVVVLPRDGAVGRVGQLRHAVRRVIGVGDSTVIHRARGGGCPET